MITKRGYFILALVFAFGLGARFAEAATRPAFQNVPFKTTGSTAQIGAPGSSVSAFPGVGNVTPVSGSGWYTAGNYGVAPPATGPTMYMGVTGDVAFSGVKYPWQAGYNVPKSAVVSAAGALLSAVGGPYTAAALFAAPYLLDWLTKSGSRVNPATGELERQDITVCSSAPCYEYWSNVEGVGGVMPRTYSPGAACTADAARIASRHVGDGKTYTGTASGAAPSYICTVTNVGYAYIGRSSIAVQPEHWLPSSMDDIAPYMAQSDVNPDGRVIQELLDKGADIPMPSPTVTGPSSVTGPSTTVVNPDGSKTVTSTTYNFNTSGNTITNTSNVTTNTTYNSSNVVTGTTTTTTTPTATEDPVDQCAKYPDSAGCSKLGEAPVADKLAKKDYAVNVVAQTFAAGGACPSPIAFNAFGHSYAISYTPACDLALLLRPLVLLLAGVLAAFTLTNSFKV